ncbi:MAG: nuclease A inhibitor family protein [Pyrinomonadaceae bacterium]
MSKREKNGIFFQKNNENNDVLFDEIKIACEGLVYISESDAPVLSFSGRITTEGTGKIILQQAGWKTDAPVEEVAFEQFFGRLTAVKDWFGEGRNVESEEIPRSAKTA